MITTSKHKSWIQILLLMTILSIIFIFLFLSSFKFTKKISCLIQSDEIFTYLFVNDKINEQLKKEQSKTTTIEFNNKNYKIKYQYIKKFNDSFVYGIENLTFKTETTNIGYFVVSNLSFWEYIN